MALREDDLICLVCKQLKDDASYTECCKKLLCATCAARCPNCPNCRRTPLRITHTGFLGFLIGNMYYKCEFCTQDVQRSDLESHKQSCECKPRKCMFAGCDFETGNKTGGLNHILHVHGTQFFENFSRLTKAGTFFYGLVYFIYFELLLKCTNN